MISARILLVALAALASAGCSPCEGLYDVLFPVTDCGGWDAGPSLPEDGAMCVESNQLDVEDGVFVPSGPLSGIARCGRESWNATSVQSCTSEYKDPPTGQCEDGDCTERTDCGSGEVCQMSCNGSCTCSCRSFCRVDADCAAGEACLCSARVGPEGLLSLPQCVPATCRTDAECGGRGCGVDFGECGAVAGLHCRTPNDECLTSDDCTGRCAAGPCRCIFDDDATRWTCQDASICVP